jgi:transcriptional regulator NrdR family protein
MAMKCPKCGADSDVKETRTWLSDNVARRTYECYGCPVTKEVHKFVTHERIAQDRKKS